MSFGKRYSRDDFAHIFDRQFRFTAPYGWRDFMAAVLFANGCRYGDTPKTSGHICWPGDDGETPAYPVRWVSKRLKAKLLKSWKIFHDKLPEDWRDCDRLWECAGYQAVGAGIGLSDFQYEHRIEDAAEMAQIEAAFKAAFPGISCYLEHISCFNGVVD